MKKEDLVAMGLTEEQADKVIGAHAEELKGFIPKSRFTEVNDTKKDLEQQIVDRDTQLTELNKKVKGNEELEQTIKDLQTANATVRTEYESKIKDVTVNSAIQSKLAETKYPELLATKFDKSKIVVGADGVVSGIDEQLTSIKEAYKDLFTPVVKGKEPNNNGSASKSITKETFSKMSYKERVELFNADQELYKSLTE